MKKMKFLMVMVGLIIMASCQKPSEKAAGNYSGNYTVGSNVYPGTINTIASGDNDNMTLTCSSLFLSSTANGVTATASGDNVSLAYSSSSTTNGDITLISGTVTSKTLSLSFTYYYSGSVPGTFSGTKP